MLLSPPVPLDALPPNSCDFGGVSVGGVPDRTISVRHGAIVSIRAGAPGDDRRFAGSVITPGLIDSHQHLPPDNALRLTGLFCLLNLMHGVTSVLEAGDSDASAVPAARRLLAEGLLPGPRVVACGPFIARPPREWPNTILLEDPVSPTTVVQAAVDRGAQVIKLYEALTRSDIAGLSAAAADRGLRAIGHVPAALDIEEAGVPEVQHFFGVPTAHSRRGAAGLLARLADWHAVDESRLESVVAASVDQGIAHTPTLVVTEGVLRAQEPVRPSHCSRASIPTWCGTVRPGSPITGICPRLTSPCCVSHSRRSSISWLVCIAPVSPCSSELTYNSPTFPQERAFSARWSCSPVPALRPQR